jgi:biopolymer transport protein ExbD
VRPRWQRTTRREPYAVDVTPFLSLMVILVPFLLITAVFTRTTILELQPAGGEASPESAADPLQLQVIVRQAGIEVSYLGLDQAMLIERSSDDKALTALANLAGELKARHPQSEAATVLLEPQIPYELLVQILDVLRIRLHPIAETSEPESLFPQIALGSVAAQTGPGDSAQ